MQRRIAAERQRRYRQRKVEAKRAAAQRRAAAERQRRYQQRKAEAKRAADATPSPPTEGRGGSGSEDHLTIETAPP